MNSVSEPSGLVETNRKFLLVAHKPPRAFDVRKQRHIHWCLDKLIYSSMRLSPHVILCAFVAIMFLPLYLALVASSHSGIDMMQAPLPLLPGKMLWVNIKAVLTEGLVATGGEPISWAFLIALGKVILALLSAFALVYFAFPMKKLCFALIFSTMMLPVEVRIVPTFQVIASFGWLNTYAGLTLPLMASATATFLFRQFFKTVPAELVDAAKLDGAGPMRFFIDILLPLSKSRSLSVTGKFLRILFLQSSASQSHNSARHPLFASHV